MSDLLLQPLVWKDLSHGDVCVVRVDTPMYDYAIVDDSKAFKVGYYNLQSPIKYATGFATIDEAKAWAWKHYNEKMQPYVKPMPTWISVNDRLPDKSGRYMVVHQTIKPAKNKSTPVDIDSYDENEKTWAFFRLGIMQEVTHWMPLPEFSTMQNLHKGVSCE